VLVGVSARSGMSVTAGQIRVEPGPHAVHFYTDDDQLVGTVGVYLADALDQHAGAVVIATEAHIRALARELHRAGIDIEAELESRRLIFLEAAATLAKLTVKGEINRAAFQRTIGPVVREATDAGRPVCAYGEMVDLLWQEGKISVAIELERLWNELIKEQRFSLLCAYDSAAVESPEHEHALREVCRLHSSVSSPPVAHTGAHEDLARSELSREFQPDDDAPAAARQLLDEALERWGDDETRLDDARLLLTELVTNAVVHARSPLVVSIRPQGSRVRLAVHDKSPAKPIVRGQTPGAPWGGWGLPIVAALSSDWGVETTSGGKTVWAEL
jgi:anti-sigma regulatory factor (Ser/Thr protein kinase)